MKAALYCRLSEEDRNKPAGTCDSGSIQNQKTMLLQYAMEQGWDVFDIYSDDDYAGADRRRPQFNRLLRDAQQHKFDIVLCKTQSRIGNMVQGKYGSVSYKTKQNRPRPREQWYRVEGTHEPIIERALWEKVQALREQRVRPFAEGTVGLFSQKARCMYCGYAMRSSKSRGKHYLKCPNRHVAKDACVGSFISVARLEEIVAAELNRMNAEYLDQDELARRLEYSGNLEQKKTRLAADVTACEKKLEECRRGLRGLYLDKVKGILSEGDYAELSKDLSAECDRLERSAAEGRKKVEELEAQAETDGGCRERAGRYMKSGRLSREIVEAMIDHIYVGKRIPGTKNVPVEIHWDF